MHKVYSPVEMETVSYMVNHDGIADVWIRTNQQSEEKEMEEGTQTEYSADEVFFQVSPEKISKEEIEADADFFYAQMKDAEDGSNADHLAIEAFRTVKKKELSAMCEETIYAGIDVDVSGEVQHFSLTEKDQINLFGKQAQLAAGVTQLEYHKDGSLCVFYSAEDMTAIITAAMSFVSYHTTYCNSLFAWLTACTKASEINEIVYGVQIPTEYQSEVLKGYLSQLGG